MRNIKPYYYILTLILAGCQSLDNNLQNYESNESVHSIPDHKIKPLKSQEVVTLKKKLPHITKEPLIAVLLARGSKISLNLLHSGFIEVNGKNINIPSGVLRAAITNKGITTSATGSHIFDERLDIKIHQIPDKPTFKAKVYPPFGESKMLALSGQPSILIDPNSDKILLVEWVGLETYLSGVLPTEISPSWPLEAIKAQAVAARSYTLDRYLARLDEPWHLHWHFTVDMAYGGLISLNNRMRVALEQTHGQLLSAHGLPVPALFHACSGGKTESAINFLPNLKGADEVTAMTDVMVSINDPYAIQGAKNLDNLKYIDWKVSIPITEIKLSLQKWLNKHPAAYMPIGKIKEISIGENFSDSGRAATVIIRHQIDNKEMETPINAATFRLAVSPIKIRSTYWKHFTMSSTLKPALIIEGHGFGHGVGLSQVSAYQMATQGKSAKDIVQYFYPGAKVVKWW